MNKNNWRAPRFALILWTVVAGLPWRVSSQIPAELGIQKCAALIVTGEVGTVYSVECADDLKEAIGPRAWRCLEFLQLPASPYLWVDKSTPADGNRFYRAVVFTAPPNLVFVPPGTFRMGSATTNLNEWPDRDTPQTSVTFTRGLWMGKYEVTQGEFQELMGYNPSYFNGIQHCNLGCNCSETTDYGVDLNRPVEGISWDEAINFCALLTEQERAAGRIAFNSEFRLPTEAEWEYAARAWTSTEFSYGDDPDYTNLVAYAWYAENSGGRTHPVGQKLPNPWGLYDMHGNVQELVQQLWDDRLPGENVMDPQRPPDGFRALRGGGSFSYGWWCRSPKRDFFVCGSYCCHALFGFRVVLVAGAP